MKSVCIGIPSDNASLNSVRETSSICLSITLTSSTAARWYPGCLLHSNSCREAYSTSLKKPSSQAPDTTLLLYRQGVCKLLGWLWAGPACKHKADFTWRSIITWCGSPIASSLSLPNHLEISTSFQKSWGPREILYYNNLRKGLTSKGWWPSSVISKLMRLKQEDCCECEPNLGYTVISRPGWATERDHLRKQSGVVSQNCNHGILEAEAGWSQVPIKLCKA